MSRLIFVPQYPTKLRYQEWWFKEFPEQLAGYFDEILVMGKSRIYDVIYDKVAKGDFASPEASMIFEMWQIREYLDTELQEDDILLMNDFSYPGLFANVLFHKKPNKCFAICHATSKNHLDYFSALQNSKFPVEEGLSKLFDLVIVASHYHQDKLGWDNIEVLRFPEPSYPINKFEGEKHGIVSVARQSEQKRSTDLEDVVSPIHEITTLDCKDWAEYYSELSKHKVMLITSKEETFGYQVVDALMTGVIPIAPNRYSYPELLPRPYLYNDEEEMLIVIGQAFGNELPPLTELKTSQSSKDFFDLLGNIMLYL